MAAIDNKSIHAAIQDFDRAAVSLNEKNHAANVDGHAALLCEYLGIEHWINLHMVYATHGVEAAVGLVNQLHDDLPTIQYNDTMEEQTAEVTATQIGKVLSWVDLDKHTVESPSKTVSSLEVDVSQLVKTNPLINFAAISKEDQAQYSECLEQLSQSEASSRNDGGIPFVPTDSPRMLELKAAEKNAMLWKLPNHSNLSPLTIEVWKRLANLTDDELSNCLNNAIHGVVSVKVHNLRDSIRMSSFRDKYSCEDTASVRLIIRAPADSSNRLHNHRSTLWNYLRPFLRCNCKQADYRKSKTPTGTCTGEMLWFDHSIWKFMMDTALAVYNDPKSRTFPEHGEAAGIRIIEQLIKLIKS